MVTWALTVLRLEHPERTFFIRVPREQTGRFERLWAEGSLDAPLSAYARSPAAGSVARLDEASPGLFDDVEPPAVAAARMEPAKGRAGGPVPPEGGKGRKRRLVPPPVALPRDRQVVPPPLPPRGRPWLIPTVVIVTLVTITVLILRIPLVPTTDTGRSPTVPGSVAIRSVGPSGSSCPVGAVCPSQGPGVTPRASPCPVGVACPSQSPGQSPGQNPCPVGVVCGSPGASRGQSPCPVGAVCGSPGASQALPSASARTAATPTPAPRTTPRPTPRPTPTPKPDRTGPSITRLAWTPPAIGAPLQAGSGCDPATNLSSTDVVTARVTDPSGIKTVTLRYQLPTGTFTKTMTKSGGVYRTTLDAASNPARWRPLIGQGSYNARLSVRAEDAAGNVRTTVFVTAFNVANC